MGLDIIPDDLDKIYKACGEGFDGFVWMKAKTIWHSEDSWSEGVELTNKEGDIVTLTWHAFDKYLKYSREKGFILGLREQYRKLCECVNAINRECEVVDAINRNKG